MVLPVVVCYFYTDHHLELVVLCRPVLAWVFNLLCVIMFARFFCYFGYVSIGIAFVIQRISTVVTA